MALYHQTDQIASSPHPIRAEVETEQSAPRKLISVEMKWQQLKLAL
jgi:hypothetical protein